MPFSRGPGQEMQDPKKDHEKEQDSHRRAKLGKSLEPVPICRKMIFPELAPILEGLTEGIPPAPGRKILVHSEKDPEIRRESDSEWKDKRFEVGISRFQMGDMDKKAPKPPEGVSRK